VITRCTRERKEVRRKKFRGEKPGGKRIKEGRTPTKSIDQQLGGGEGSDSKRKEKGNNEEEKTARPAGRQGL